MCSKAPSERAGRLPQAAAAGGSFRGDRLTATAHGYSLEVVTHDVTPGADDWSSPPWGEDAAFRRNWRPVTALRIWHGDEALDVPRSAFADLSRVNRVGIAPLAEGCTVVLEGSDAGSAWQAFITVSRDRVTERHVQLGEFPDTYETTTYVVGTPTPGE